MKKEIADLLSAMLQSHDILYSDFAEIDVLKIERQIGQLEAMFLLFYSLDAKKTGEAAQEWFGTSKDEIEGASGVARHRLALFLQRATLSRGDIWTEN